MQVERDERVAGALDLSDEAADLALVQQQRPRPRGIGVHVRRRRRKRRDVRADQLDPAVLDDHVGFLQLRATRANRLHLPTFERKTRLEFLLDEVVVIGFSIVDDAHASRLRGPAILDNTNPMTRVKKSVLVPYSAAAMFDLVDRVELYPQFLPWCAG